MILSPVSLLDCVVAGLIVAPLLLWNAGLLSALDIVITGAPFVLVKLPFHIVSRYVKAPASQPWFIRDSSLFEDILIRIVRFGFMNFPIETIRVFLCKEFAWPFLKWRMFSNGHFTFPVHLQESHLQEGNISASGIWLKHDPKNEPDVVVYYIHGGGFALASCYFYLEFLLAMHHLLLGVGYSNPAIFAVEYTLVPEKTHPTQVNQALLGYRHILEEVKDASKVCVAGDSAGGTLTLSLLLELGNRKTTGREHSGIPVLPVPRLAVLISPWITLVSNIHYPSEVDYLERNKLWKYGKAYAGPAVNDVQASPGTCEDGDRWKAGSPDRGYFVVYGEEETLAPDAEAFIRHQRQNRIEIDAMEFKGGIHAWPVASLMLSGTKTRRLQGLEAIVGQVRRKVGNGVIRNKDKLVSLTRTISD